MYFVNCSHNQHFSMQRKPIIVCNLQGTFKKLVVYKTCLRYLIYLKHVFISARGDVLSRFLKTRAFISEVCCSCRER